jgi:hypothetical protein
MITGKWPAGDEGMELEEEVGRDMDGMPYFWGRNVLRPSFLFHLGNGTVVMVRAQPFSKESKRRGGKSKQESDKSKS